MIIKPKNKWVQVALDFDKESEKDNLIALPDDYKPASVKGDPEGEYKYGDVVVVPTHIIREIDLEEHKFYLVERSHIMATVEPA